MYGLHLDTRLYPMTDTLKHHPKTHFYIVLTSTVHLYMMWHNYQTPYGNNAQHILGNSAQPVHICPAQCGKSDGSASTSHDNPSAQWHSQLPLQPRLLVTLPPIPHHLSQVQQHPRQAACCPAAAAAGLEAHRQLHCGC